ncbi:hypothetical protein CGRA01v4_06169 [Colletotrichum graminicola]|nr:hypothetical protein CGRA01v4_06169 [Colletotrichum graminicola]
MPNPQPPGQRHPVGSVNQSQSLDANRTIGSCATLISCLPDVSGGPGGRAINQAAQQPHPL